MASFEELCSDVADNNPFVKLEGLTCGIPSSVLEYYQPPQRSFERQYLAIDLSSWRTSFHSGWSLQTALANGTSTLWLRYILPGTFKRGLYQVTLTKGFYMGVFPVTQRQWELVMGNNPSHFTNAGPSAPVEKVSYEDIRPLPLLGRTSFLGRIRQCSGLAGLDLPTMAQWMYACSVGTTGGIYFNNLDAIAWYADNSNGTTHGVGQKRPNAWGLYDMVGNVYEWPRDGWYDSFWPTRDEKDPVGDISGHEAMQVLGGAYDFRVLNLNNYDNYGLCGNYYSTHYEKDLGFRLVLVS